MRLQHLLIATTSLFVLIVYVHGHQGAIADETDPHAASKPTIRGILYNDDDDNRFSFDPAGSMKAERLDQIVDDLANSQVTAMFICCNAKDTCYASKVWDVRCRGFDPSKDNRQPYFGDMPDEWRDSYRRRTHNLKVLLDAGVDPMGRMIDRCRKRSISPWVSIRMNDVHDADILKSPLHSRFWLEHPEYWRYPNRFTSWYDRCLNYGMKPVRDHYMALIREVCDRYDLDGLELDWLRFQAYFREGEEIEQGKVLTEWLAEVREVTRLAEKKWKHPVWIAARVPTRPEVSAGIGLDAVTWAKRGVIDHLIVSPFFGTTEFDIPLERWIAQLKDTGVGVTAGLECHVRPHPGSEALPNTPERRRGAAMAALARGSQGIYVYNHYDLGRHLPYLLKEMGSVDSLVDKDRTYTVTFVNISIPGKPIPAALPKNLAPDKSAGFRLFIGPKPLPNAQGKVVLTIKPEEKAGEKRTVSVMLNGKSADAENTFKPSDFKDGYNMIRVTNNGKSQVSVECVELELRFPPVEKGKK